MVKYKKWAIALGYSGRNYFGMQRQSCDNKVIDSLPTIESELLKAFHSSGLINDNEFNTPNVMHFQRAARTDKGVSAIKQIISMNVANDVDSYLPKINEILPSEIRVFAAKRTTKFFDSKNFCGARTYSYLLPTFALCPDDDLNGESKQLPSEYIEKFNSILKCFVGTHNFHNFTAQKKSTDPSARRFILSFESSSPFIQTHKDQSLEFVVVRVKGQSFMLHQIRKMIGLAIAIMKGLTNIATIERCFEQERIDVPMAPGLGLLLEEVHYERYNKKYGGDGIHEAIVWEDYNDQINHFKTDYIYPQMVETEINDKSMLNWLSTLPLHSFDVRLIPINSPIVKENVEVVAEEPSTEAGATQQLLNDEQTNQCKKIKLE